MNILDHLSFLPRRYNEQKRVEGQSVDRRSLGRDWKTSYSSSQHDLGVFKTGSYPPGCIGLHRAIRRKVLASALGSENAVKHSNAYSEHVG